MEFDLSLLDDMPERRWQVIALLVESGRMPRRRAGEDDIRRGFHFLRRYKAPAPLVSKLVLRDEYPELYWAYGLYENPKSERWIIEAGLLTDVPLPELAEYVAKPLGVVQTYERMFYDVRDRLGSRGYILNRVLMPSYSRGMHSRDFDLMFKTLAYCAGWSIFKEFIDSGVLTDDSRSFLESGRNDRLLKLGWMASHRLEVNNFNALEVMDLCLKLQEMEQNLKGGTRDDVNKLLAGLLQSCVTTMLPRDCKVIDEPRAGVGVGLKYGEAIPVTAEVHDGKAEQN